MLRLLEDRIGVSVLKRFLLALLSTLYSESLARLFSVRMVFITYDSFVFLSCSCEVVWRICLDSFGGVRAY